MGPAEAPCGALRLPMSDLTVDHGAQATAVPRDLGKSRWSAHEPRCRVRFVLLHGGVR
jgi:hypothetical protein